MQSSRRRALGRALPLLLAASLAAACTNGGSRQAADPGAEDPGASLSGGSSSGVVSGSSPGGSLELFSRGSSVAGDSPSVPGLTVHASASATVAADQAFVVISAAVRGADPLGDSVVSSQDRRAVLDAVMPLGVPADDVSFPTTSRYGEPSVRVKVGVDALPATGPRVVDAVERVLGRSRASGAAFGLSDCEPAAAPLRRQAAQSAEDQARSLAEASHTSIGPILAVRQDVATPRATIAGGFTGGCPGATDSGPQGFDARPAVTLTVGLTATYAIAGAPVAGAAARPQLSAVGSSTTRAKADQAYVLVVYESDNDTVPAGPTKAQRQRVLDAVAKLGIDRKGVDFVTTGYPARVVRVETRAAGLDKTGKEVVRAVEDVLGRSDSVGAQFASSTCKALQAKARKDAVADARRRAGELADAAGVKLGDLQGVAEYGLAPDPCDDSAASLSSFDQYQSPLQPFDGEPEVDVRSSVELSFGIGS